MCDPLTIGGALLTGASVVANQAADSQVQSARSGAMNSELFRQRGYDAEANNINTQARGRYDNAQGGMDDRAKQVADFYAANNAALPTSGPTTGALPTSSSNIIVQEGKRQGDKVAAYTKQQGEALGRLRSFGDVLGEASRGTAKDAAALGSVNSFKAGSQSVLPLELQAANSAGNGTRMLGDILGGVGKVGMFAGLSGGNPFGGGSIGTASSPASMIAPHGTRVVSEPSSWSGIFNMFR
jgi:hypothetical protein